jgi:hypothetical protein
MHCSVMKVCVIGTGGNISALANSLSNEQDQNLLKNDVSDLVRQCSQSKSAATFEIGENYDCKAFPGQEPKVTRQALQYNKHLFQSGISLQDLIAYF